MLFFGSILNLSAQEIKGVISDLESSQKLKDVKIKNLRTNEQTTSDVEGKFSIKGQLNDHLALEIRGYDRDTAFIYQEGLRQIFMIRDKSVIQIDEVVVTKITDSRLSREIERAKNNSKAVETSQNKGGLRLSPSRLFGKEAKLARNSIKILELEQEQRQVERVFTNQLIRSLVPLDENELPLFKEKYRPSYQFIKGAAKEDLTSYILDSYSKFKKNK